MNTAEEIIKASSSYVVSTIDDYGFPLSVTLSKILVRTGYVTLFFYFDEKSNFVNNMKKRPKGSVSISVEHPDRIETLNLKGTFTFETDWDLKSVRDIVNDAESKLNYENPVVVVFETLNHEIEVVNKYI